MRIVWRPAPTSTAAETIAQAVLAEAAGLDGIWLDDGLRTAAVVAGAIAARTTGLRVHLAARLGDDNPVYLVEEALVAENLLGGRLSLVLAPAPGHDEHLAEAVALVAAALGGRPFRHPGPRWPTPAGLEQNVHNTEQFVRIGPGSVQEMIPVWIDSTTTTLDIATLDLPAAVTGVVVPLATTRATAPVSGRLRLAALVDAGLSAGEIVEAARLIDDGLGPDTLVVTGRSANPDEVAGAMHLLASEVRPLFQMHRFPPGLVEHWASTAPEQPPA